ncbi:MAG: MBOAT family protein [Candidatus Moranbacteria bacterium]|nr:MBOAT family protein [Candidatus Moranbacteria bacterium]
MLFNSIQFLIFFPTVILLYFWIPYRYRWILLLIASYYFYMSWKPEYAVLILLSTAVDYYAGIKMGDAKDKNEKKKYLFASFVFNLGLLFTFKYFNFFSDSFRLFVDQFSLQFDPIHLKLLLPVGISFYTFQSLSYTIDVYRERIKPERHFGIFALYVSFFPQLVAGPIERADNLLPQFRKKFDFDYKRITDGLKIMLWGFFLKVVIADRLGMAVEQAYGNPEQYSGLPLLLATYFFSFQIYCDFAGYSLIAIGSAQIMGYNLMDNFRRPYFSKSIAEFWKRWHISLSTWFRDYLYIPLGGNRVAKSRWLFNLFVVFLVSGLWHGANWNFVIWGGLHGIYLVGSIVTENIRNSFVKIIGLSKIPKVHSFVKIFITFHLVALGWIFFRTDNVADAWYIISHIFSGAELSIERFYMGFSQAEFIVAILSIFFMESVHLMQEHIKIRKFFSERSIFFRYPVYIIILAVILLFGVFEETDFIYFQF